MDGQIVPILIVFSFFLFIFLLIVRYILLPLFIRPILLQSEILTFLNNKQLIYREHHAIGQKQSVISELSFYQKITSISSYFIIIGYSKENNTFQVFYAIVTKNLAIPFSFPKNKKRSIHFIEETNLNVLKTWIVNQKEIIEISNFCPACGNKTNPQNQKCTSCGLAYI